MNTSTKRCTKCGNEYPATSEYFYEDRRGSAVRLIAKCKKCRYPETRTWRMLHPDKIKEYDHRYGIKHRQKRTASNHRWISNNPKKRKEYNEKKRGKKHNTPQQIHKSNHIRRTKKYGLPIRFQESDWRRALDYFGGSCAVCGRPPGLWHKIVRDHWIPLSDPRPDNPGTVPANIVPLCHGINGCNNIKTNRNPTEWLTRKFGPRKTKAILKRISDYFAWVRTQE